ncbi:MAG TPA: efflux transporter outer membrane subunit [Usitatibacter sp.]|nr:efflux transporter outer membrane subunit [Usitatibacter sp.]
MRGLDICIALGLAGCAMVGPDYRRPESPLPASFPAAEASAAAAASVGPQWWRLYNDRLLDELIASGLERNADVRLAAARVEEAEASLREARATLFFPLVEGSGGASRARTIRTGLENTFDIGLSTSFEIDLWGRLRRAERSVREELLASRYARDTVSLTLAGAIARTYFAARSLDSQYTASQEILRAATDSVELTRKRADAGVASILEVYQAGTLRTAAAGQAKEIARQRAVIVHQLGVLTGQLGLQLPAGEVTSLPLPPLPPAGLPSQLLERRPDVREAEASLAAATERIGVARAAQLPTLSLTGTLGRESADLDGLFRKGASVWSIGAGLIGPVIDGGRYAARTAQAEAQARQAEATYQRAVETAFREVSDALSNVRLAADTETDLAQRVDTARKATGLALRRYEAGYSAYLEVLEAQRTLNEALLAFIRNRQAYLAYTVDLMSALGGGWSAKDT